MSNSALVNCTVKSPNHSGARTHAIDRITPHCVVGQLSAESIGGCFTSSSAQASCNYGIGSDGRVVLCVDEGNRSWCSSSNANDQRAVTIECASDLNAPYAMTTAVYEKLIKLCTDICKRNGKKKLLWMGDKNKTLNYSPKSDEMVLSVHRWFANKSCPGDWLYSRLGDLANRVNEQLGSSDETLKDTDVYTVQSGDTLSGIAKKYGCTVDELAAYNGISNPSLIVVGQEIWLPKEAPEFKVGKKYRLLADNYIRTAPSGGYRKYKDLTASAKKKVIKFSDDKVKLKKGNVVEAREVYKKPDGDIWIRIKNGWLCAVHDGQERLKKA